MEDYFEEESIETYTAAQPQIINQARDTFDVFAQPAAVVIVSAEQQQRKDQLRLLEEERNRLNLERDQQEREQKQQRRLKAKEYLAQFKDQLERETQQRKENNKSKQELRDSGDYVNQWDKVAKNIALRDGEYPGEKDVSRMRQAILNKRK